MQKTQNYQLNQYEPQDSFLRADFNADNQKIDTALKKVADKADSAATRTELAQLSQRVDGKADQTALTQGLAKKCEVFIGRYNGQVAEGNKEIQTVSLGFRPRAVFLIPNNGYLCDTSGRRYGGLIGQDFPIYSGDPETGWMGQITDSGFQVRNMDFTLLNSQNHIYTYLALR